MLDHIPCKTFHNLVWLMLRGCGSTVSNSQNILWSSLIIPSVCSNKLNRQTIKTGTPQIMNTLRNCATVTQQLIWGLRFQQWWRFDLWSSGLWCLVFLQNGGGAFLYSNGNHLQDYTGSQPRRPKLTHMLFIKGFIISELCKQTHLWCFRCCMLSMGWNMWREGELLAVSQGQLQVVPERYCCRYSDGKPKCHGF
jgi:hypothetical protein